jgi:hypothetical protein
MTVSQGSLWISGLIRAETAWPDERLSVELSANTLHQPWAKQSFYWRTSSGRSRTVAGRMCKKHGRLMCALQPRDGPHRLRYVSLCHFLCLLCAQSERVLRVRGFADFGHRPEFWVFENIRCRKLDLFPVVSNWPNRAAASFPSETYPVSETLFFLVFEDSGPLCAECLRSQVANPSLRAAASQRLRAARLLFPLTHARISPPPKAASDLCIHSCARVLTSPVSAALPRSRLASASHYVTRVSVRSPRGKLVRAVLSLIIVYCLVAFAVNGGAE